MLNLCGSYASEDNGTAEHPRLPGAFAGRTIKSNLAMVTRLKTELKRSFKTELQRSYGR